MRFNPLKAYTAISIMLLILLTKNWQTSSLSFFYGFQGVGNKFQNPHYEISAAFPEMNKYYGLLTGMVYDIPYSICGLLSTTLCQSTHRVGILGLFMILISSTQITSAWTSTFSVIILMRWVLAMFSSSLEPLCYSLTADYFPSYRRAKANAILQAGTYFGLGFSSVSILLIKQMGWRQALSVIGSIGVAAGLLSWTILKDPRRNRAQSVQDQIAANQQNEVPDV